MKVFKGGYKIVSLLNIDITSDFTISGIYDDIKDSHGKPILVSEINVGGEKMNDAYTIVKQDNTDYIIEVYGYSLTIASDDSVTVASLPEITSIGTGLTLEDGELSAESGGKIYLHNIAFNIGSYNMLYYMIIYSSSNIALNEQGIHDYLNNLGYNAETKGYPIVTNSVILTGNNDRLYLPSCIYAKNTDEVHGRFVDWQSNNTISYVDKRLSNITDTIFEV